MLAIVNGMDAVNYKLLQNLTAYKGYPVLFSNWMDAVNSPKPNGCYLLSMEWMLLTINMGFTGLRWLSNSVE